MSSASRLDEEVKLVHALTSGIRAYQRAREAKSQRELEAEVFATAAGRLRGALLSGSDMDVIRARADARRLFSTLRVLTLHPANELPQLLRAGIVAVCDSALREVERPTADLEFLAALCDDFRDGLLATPRAGAP